MSILASAAQHQLWFMHITDPYRQVDYLHEQLSISHPLCSYRQTERLKQLNSMKVNWDVRAKLKHLSLYLQRELNHQVVPKNNSLPADHFVQELW